MIKKILISFIALASLTGTYMYGYVGYEHTIHNTTEFTVHLYVEYEKFIFTCDSNWLTLAPHGKKTIKAGACILKGISGEVYEKFPDENMDRIVKIQPYGHFVGSGDFTIKHNPTGNNPPYIIERS